MLVVKSLLTGFGLVEDRVYEVKKVTKYDYEIICGGNTLLRDKCFFLPMEESENDGTGQLHAAVS